MPYAHYYASAPAPKEVTHDALSRLIPVSFTTVEDALHAALLLRLLLVRLVLPLRILLLALRPPLLTRIG
jgi:hypothetical protein